MSIVCGPGVEGVAGVAGTSSCLVFDRPRKKNKAPRMATMATVPTTIPAIPPTESLTLLPAGVDGWIIVTTLPLLSVGLGVVPEPSAGQGSPGDNWKLAFRAPAL